MNPFRLSPGAVVARFASRLRFPQLFWLTVALFLLDLAIPDLVPFADEVLLALLGLLFGTWRKEPEPEPEIKNVTPHPPAPRSPKSG